MRQHAEDVAKQEAQFTKYEVFRCTSDLVVVTTGDVKADKDLLRRVILALESCPDVDVNTLLQSELAPVPKSLATLDGSLREAGKSDLGTILQNKCL